MISIETKQRVEEDQVQRKLRLERRLARVTMQRYSQLVSGFAAIYPATGAAPAIEPIADGMKASLEAHYLIVQRDFEDQFQEDIGVQLPPEAATLAAFAFGAWIAQRSTFNATNIIASARNFILSVLSRVREEVTDQVGNVPSNSQTFNGSKRAIAHGLGIRSRLVGNVETQAASEATKSITAEAAAGVKPRVVAGVPAPTGPTGAAIITARKTWLTQQDERVRSRHIITEGQRRPATALYDVGGQSLMFPGDTSNGADLANVINCRCSSFFERVEA